MPPTNGRAASTGCPTSQFARTPLTACCSYEKNDEETEAKCGGGVGSEVPVPAGGLGAVETAEAAGLVFNEKNAFIVVGVPRGGGVATWGGKRRRGALDRGQETIISQIAANCLSRPRVD